MIGLTLAACGGATHGPVFNGCQAPSDGILLLRWTIRGAAPSAVTCAGVDHLVLSLDTPSCGGATIEPVPCALDKFRYDNLPRGPADIALAAVDAAGNLLSSGQTTANLSTSSSAPPATLDLR